ncbi:MAG: hypothetical protein J5496_00830 [Lachnospiraceae bacterium]|nr:hypothetical protein [Lachnospiraceae bacterium]
MREHKINIRILFTLLLCAVLLLSGCSLRPLKEKQMREKAEAYLQQLSKQSGVSDTFSLSDRSVSIPAKASLISFPVRSETYQDDFNVYVSQDLNTVLDDYYRLYLKQEASEKVNAVFKSVLGEGGVGAEVTLRESANPSLSGHAAGSLEELIEASGSTLILEIRAKVSEKNEIREAEADRLMLALQEAGCYGSFFPYASDAKYFQIEKDGFWTCGSTGADGGAYAYRDRYEPGK